MREINKLIIHCSGAEEGTFEGIRAYHKAPPPEGKGWDDIGYHYVVDKEGVVHPGRSDSTVGAHCQNHNEDSLGICAIGLWDFTDKQMNALVDLIHEKMGQYALNWDQVHSHNEFDTAKAQHKSCPNIPGAVLRLIARRVV